MTSHFKTEEEGPDSCVVPFGTKPTDHHAGGRGRQERTASVAPHCPVGSEKEHGSSKSSDSAFGSESQEKQMVSTYVMEECHSNFPFFVQKPDFAIRETYMTFKGNMFLIYVCCTVSCKSA